MHFTIPDYSYQVAKYGLHSYVLYNIHINSEFFCTLRFRQLLGFRKQLEKHYGQLQQEFPSKKMFLTSNQIEERRAQLEKYFQTIFQTPQYVNSDICKQFFLEAQRETLPEVKLEEICLEIYQLDLIPSKTIVQTFDSLEDVLRKYAREIDLDENLLRHFSLHLALKTSGNTDCKLIRQLECFEAPYLSLATAKKFHQGDCKSKSFVLLIRYNSHLSFDDHDEEKLYLNVGAMNIIYHQTVYDFTHHNLDCDSQTHNLLTSLQAKDDKLEFLKVAQTLKHYNHIHFEPCCTKFPESLSLTKISVGDRKLWFTIVDSKEEYSFSIVRIKCWRLTLSNTLYEENASPPSQEKYELSFEYLASKSNLQWITIYSLESVQISNCLQSIVGKMVATTSTNDNTMMPSGSYDSCLTPNHSFSSSRNFESETDVDNDNSYSSSSVASAFIENNIFNSIGDDNL